MVIVTDNIFSTTPDEKLFLSVFPAIAPGEREKSRVICAVLHKDHFDLGVLRTSDSVQAVFRVGPEWDRARRELLSFVKARSPQSGVERGFGPTMGCSHFPTPTTTTGSGRERGQ
jgi:hypothetical protein